MSNILEVIEPILGMSEGETMILSEDKQRYVYSRSEENNISNTNDSKNYTIKSEVEISTSCAKELIEDGYLKEIKKNDTYINVFEEIDRLSAFYAEQLKNIDVDCADVPACMKVEKDTVLRNIIKVLDHLYTLKK